MPRADDFIIKEKYQHFATFFGKDSSHGIGGTAETAAETTGLQRPIQDQTITPLDSCSWVETNLKGIIFRYTNTGLLFQREKGVATGRRNPPTWSQKLATHVSIPFHVLRAVLNNHPQEVMFLLLFLGCHWML